ncbi:MAG: hypothetical protein OEY31_00770 [Candidatus Bathyarchaeota archaeon]|jgi:hypothetical protein|nr:hypothetical protein [Candidatus Bathyarchaeota archaeon]
MMKKGAATRRWQYAILAVGVSVCLVGAFLMGWGEPILGENHAGIATVIGIVGIGIVASAKRGEA